MLAEIDDDGPALEKGQFFLVLQEPVQSSGQEEDKGRTELADLAYSLCFLRDFLEQLHFLPSWPFLDADCALGSVDVSGSDVQQLVLLEQVVDIPLPLLDGVLRRWHFLFFRLLLFLFFLLLWLLRLLRVLFVASRVIMLWLLLL